MCDPFSITALALSAAGAAASYAAQQQAAEAQAKYQNEVARQTGDIAQSNYLQQTGAATARLGENALSASEAVRENSVAGLQAAGSANVAAAESGVSGNSVEALLQDFRRQEAQASDAIRTNQGATTAQIQSEEEGLRAQAQSRIAGSRPGPVNYPSALALGLQIGGAAFSAYDNSMYQTRTGPYDENARLSSTGTWFKPLPFLGSLLPPRAQPQQGGRVFSS